MATSQGNWTLPRSWRRMNPWIEPCYVRTYSLWPRHHCTNQVAHVLFLMTLVKTCKNHMVKELLVEWRSHFIHSPTYPTINECRYVKKNSICRSFASEKFHHCFLWFAWRYPVYLVHVYPLDSGCRIFNNQPWTHPYKPKLYDKISLIHGFILYPDAPWCWYIYLHDWVIFRANVGKYSSTMEHMGYCYYICFMLIATIYVSIYVS